MKNLCITKLLDNIYSGVIVYGPDASVIYVNKSACNILKIDSDDLLGKNLFEINWRIVDASGNTVDNDKRPSSLVYNGQEESCEMLLGIENILKINQMFGFG